MMDKMIFLNIAWMNDYQGITINDIPKHGGSYIAQNKSGAEVYNFLPFNGEMYGFVEAGWKPTPRCINITNLGASKQAQAVDSILVVWVARHSCKRQTLVVGWYKNATVYRARQTAPKGSQRNLPDGKEARYFATAEEQNCTLVPTHRRTFVIPRAEKDQEGVGQKNIWYATGEHGRQIKAKVLEYILQYK